MKHVATYVQALRNWFDRTRAILVGAIAFLAIAVIVLIILLVQKQPEAEPAESGVFVSLGNFEYRFDSGRAVKRSNSELNDLRAMLETRAKLDIELGCETSHYNVVAVSEDSSQILLAYGCDQPTARMFAVKKSELWETVPPTGQFDNFGIPSCEHVTEHAIARSIAPVCVAGLQGPAGKTSYNVR